jgi:acetylglutamate/LysW-gamma-L-alpha-aminoadipate kinase
MIVVKVGGGASINLDGIAGDLAHLDEPAVVVHGANAFRDDLSRRLAIPKRTLTSESGVESVFTDRDALDVLTMAYAGLVNKRFVSLCQQKGVNAIGLTGLDGALVRGRRNRGIRVRENGVRRLVHDLSGKPAAVNGELLRLLVDAGYTLLLTAPILDEQGQAISTENDDVVALLQRTLEPELVVELIEAPGLLDDPKDESSVRKALGRDELERRESTASGRMRRKLKALLKMLDAGCRRIVIADGRGPHPLRAALASEGTVVS